jgi:hypothetical protein
VKINGIPAFVSFSIANYASPLNFFFQNTTIPNLSLSLSLSLFFLRCDIAATQASEVLQKT